MCGLKFRVLPSDIDEEALPKPVSYAALVKRNALAKARDVASRVKSGVVIGADTIVVQGRKIFGKPKDLRAARAMLATLSQGPQWVYTGIAVVDKGGRLRELVSCEKTKIVMDKITDKEMRSYFFRVSPLDKAGSFDIQGKGAFFIRRVEGCFYNVVGLPLSRLYRMFKQIGLRMLCLSVCFLPFCAILFLSGCSTEYNIATGQEEKYYYSTDKEVAIGQSIAKDLEEKNKIDEDPLMSKRVRDIGKKIVNVCDRKDIRYTFHVLDVDEVNAVSLPGGFIYINRGLIEKVDNDDQLAGVIAHEVGHVVARHSIKKLQAIMGYSVLRLMTVAIPQGGAVGTTADVAFTELLLGYGRDDELLADELAARYTRLAGYNPQGMIVFLEKLQELNRRRPLQPRSYFKTHPYVPDRIRVVKQEMGQQMNFSDYINIEETKGQ
jgi:MAF protein